MSNLGIGHQMSLRIDNDLNLTDISNGYTPDIDGSPAGSIFYRLPELSAGNHTATLRIRDTAGNSASASIDFFVNPDLAPRGSSTSTPTPTQPPHLCKLLRDPQPPVTPHSQSASRSTTSTANSSRDSRDHRPSRHVCLSPRHRNLTDRAGSKVTRGIYLYKTTVTTGGQSSTMTKRIAVAPL